MTFDDAETLPKYAKLMPGTNEFSSYVQAAILSARLSAN